MIEIKAPGKVEFGKGTTLFLAGSIEMGTAEKWQDVVVKELTGKPVTILNPRRDDWDVSWIQDINNPQFFEQVSWELNGLENSNYIIVVFDKNTKSPITLMELGMICMLGLGDGHIPHVFVCCPTGFYRKGNVDIICARSNIPVFETLNELIRRLKREL